MKKYNKDRNSTDISLLIKVIINYKKQFLSLKKIYFYSTYRFSKYCISDQKSKTFCKQ